MTHSFSHIIKRDGSRVPFDQRKITVAIHKAAGAVGIHDKPLCDRLSNEVVLELAKKSLDPQKNPPTVEEIQDIVEETLVRNQYAAIAKAYILYRNARAAARQGKVSRAKPLDILPYKKMWERLSWNCDHACETVEKLNAHIRSGSIQNLIADAEHAYHSDVEAAANAILERREEVKIVIIAGPSSSGKTTTTIKLAEALRKEGLKLIALNVDNYFFNLECHPKDECGDYDFETPEALDLKLINDHLGDLILYKKVQVPRYDFKTGKRLAESDSFQIDHDQIILLDTLHGLYEPLTSSVPVEKKFRLYIEPISQLKDTKKEFTHWTDIRLLRRMTRDARQRAYDPKRTLEHWHYVRRSELKHIIPYMPTADYIVNGSLSYELPVLKKYMFHHFPHFVKTYENDPVHADAYMRAKRVFDLLSSLETIENDDVLVPKNSVLREFIGGSSYTYHV